MVVVSGQKPGVNMVWGHSATFGHFGLDLNDRNAGLLRRDDLAIEDVTELFQNNLLKNKKVKNYSDLGHGTNDVCATFVAADAMAAGREIIVPSGRYCKGRNLTLHAPVYFEGSVRMAEVSVL